MARLSEEEINDIRAKANIVDIIGGYIPLIKKGKDYKCVCPFHDDHSPSMSISESKQIYKCFSCNNAGNVFTFVQNYEHVSFLEAVKIVADKIGYHLNGIITSNEDTKFNTEYKIMDLAKMFYQNNLNTAKGIKAKEYLLKRGITDNTIKTFGIGLSLDEPKELADLLIKKGYDLKLLNDLGLANIAADNYYDTFTRRITFPLNNSNGHVVGFSCRIYRDDDAAKYINTKETYLYKKGDNLFNYYLAKPECKKTKQLIIVEGQMDAIRLYINGFKNVVALMGTALTKEQIALIKNLHVKVLLCLDGDSPGQEATILNGNLLTEAGITVEVLHLADYKDPDEYILNKGPTAFQTNLNNAVAFLDFKVEYQKQQYNLNNTEELATYINQVIADINKENDPILRELALNKISKQYEISVDTLKIKLTNLNKTETIAKEVFNNEEPKVSLSSIDKAACKVLYYMINDIKYIKVYQNKLGYFLNQNYRQIANEIVYFSEQNKAINEADFISYMSTKLDLYPTVMQIINLPDETLTMDNFIAYLKAIDHKRQEEEIKKLKIELTQEMDMAKKIAITARIAELKKGSVLDVNE
jgi:DNA primase